MKARKRNADGKFRELTLEEKEKSLIIRKEYQKRYKKENREKIREQEKERRKKNPEKFKINKLNYRKRHPEKDKEYARNNPEISRTKSKKGREELTDNYIAGRLTYNTNLTCSDVRKHPELIEVKRQIIKTKRLCKTSQN